MVRSRTKAGLSEVRFFYTPVWAREPKPATGSIGIDPAVTLSWRAGREAVSHNVYLGTDSQCGSGPPGNACGLQRRELHAVGYRVWVRTYYWMIEEVNAGRDPGPHGRVPSGALPPDVHSGR